MAKQLGFALFKLFQPTRPLRVIAGPIGDCGIVFLSAGGKVKKRHAVLPILKVTIPDASHNCANHLDPKPGDTLDLADFASESGVSLRGKPGIYADPIVAGRESFFHPALSPARSPGDWEATDAGGG